MKYFFLLFVLTITDIVAQSDLKFDKRFIDCEDKWVAFQKNIDSSYTYGFIYLDTQGGLTSHFYGSFKISQNGKFLNEDKFDTIMIKMRLEPNDKLVAIIPNNRFEELEIPAVPKWLYIYKSDSSSVERLFSYGYLYNGWNECEKALKYLEQVQKINPKFEKLDVELAFSYNCLNQSDKAVTILENALEHNSTEAYYHKELIFALLNTGQIEKAMESCKNAINKCTDKTYNCENCYNILHHLYIIKDKNNFNTWMKFSNEWTSENELFTKNIKLMEQELLK